jgi:adenine-specific DNA-methyltransferase
MATGIPARGDRHVDEGTVSLTYPDKTDEHVVLARKPPIVHPVWRRNTETKNRLYFGDNLGMLAALKADTTMCGKVRLIYIDPPFATEGVFLSRQQEHAYRDTVNGAAYIESLRQRLIFLKQLLADDGSIYIHIDERMVFHVKLLMDEVFGAGNYRNCITRKKCNPKNYTRKTFGNVIDYILFYTKTADYTWNRQYEPWTEARAKEYQYVDEKTGRKYMKVPVHAPGTRNGETGGPWRGYMPPPGKHWQYRPSRLDEMDAKGEIFWSTSGNPRRKVFLDDRPGIGIQDIWLDCRDAHNQNVHITGYPTEKNPDVLRRIILASSNPGDTVLDCYCGSGTTLTVAAELGRNWIGVDNSPQAIKTVLHRFLHGTKAMGDFVTAEPKDEGAGDDLGLFRSLKEEDRGDIEVTNYKPTTDFVVLTEEGSQQEITGIVSDWSRQLARLTRGGQPSQVAERYEGAEAEVFLTQADDTMGTLIRRFGPCPLQPHTPKLEFLIEAIVGQQLSPKAANAIYSRLRAICHGRLTAQTIGSRTVGELRKAGISTRKAECIKAVARAVEDDSIPMSRLPNMSDTAVRETFTSVKGIGPWTADMVLVFALGRKDVFPIEDVALRNTIARLYKVDSEDTKAILEIAERWRPYRSIASWHLYRCKNAEEDARQPDDVVTQSTVRTMRRGTDQNRKKRNEYRTGTKA